MDATVTARVPVEIKEQGNALLKSLGSSPTQLINAAYRYLLKEKRLPEPEQPQGTKKRKLAEAQKKALARSLKVMHLASLEQDEQGSGAIDSAEAQLPSFKEQLNTARDERYAHSS